LGTNELLPLQFKSVSVDYPFPSKTPAKDVMSVEGIIKFNWPTKHFELVPSVVLYCVPFGVDWSAGEWSKRELAIFERFSRLKSTLGTRDIKVIMIMIKIGVGVLEKDALDDRVSAFKRHAQTDSKSFVFFSLNELTSDNSVIRRLFKTIREGSFSYYAANIKRFKISEKSIPERFKGCLEQMLTARYDFKIAFFNEFQGQSNYTLRYYRQCYNSLSASLETIDEEMYDQVKVVAEIAHFKICKILFAQKNAEEAFQQFRNHILIYTKLYSKYAWKHCSWVSDQFIVFCQLLDRYSISESFAFADRAYFYQNAAKFTVDRYQCYLKSRKDVSTLFSASDEVVSSVDPVSGVKSKSYRGKLFTSPRFIGSMPFIIDPVNGNLPVYNEEALSLFFDYLYAQESSIDHFKLAMDYLQTALQHVPIHMKRKRALLFENIAQEECKREQFAQALTHYWQAVESLYEEGWSHAAMSLLLSICRTSMLLGRLLDYVRAALYLYGSCAYLYFSRYELEELHLNLMSIFHSSLQPTPSMPSNTIEKAAVDIAVADLPFVKNSKTFLTSSYLPITNHPEYGQFASPDEILRTLPNEYNILADKRCKLFEISTYFNVNSVDLGQKLQMIIEIKSLILDTIVFDEMIVFSFEDIVQRRFFHRDDSNDSKTRCAQCEEDGNYSLNLTLLPFQCIRFQSDWEVTEDIFSRYLVKDSVFGVDRIQLFWRRDPCIISFSLPGYPVDIQDHYVRNQKKQQWNTKELFTFSSQYDRSPIVRISRPRNILKMIFPSNQQSISDSQQFHSVNMLEGLMQRIDIVFEVGDYQLDEIRVFLSSDFMINSIYDALFWTPDLTALAVSSSTSQHPTLDQLNEIPFFPFLLNASMQPAYPLKIGGLLKSQSLLYVPLFVRANRPGKFEVKLSVECVPFTIMKSSVTKEFSLLIQVTSPLTVQHEISAVDVSLMADCVAQSTTVAASTAIYPKERYLLTSELQCKSVLNNNISILSAQLSRAQFADSMREDTSSPIRSRSSHYNGTVSATANKSNLVLVDDSVVQRLFSQDSSHNMRLKPQEAVLLTLPFVCSSSNNDDEIGLGDLEVGWQDPNCHPLFPPFHDFDRDGEHLSPTTIALRAIIKETQLVERRGYFPPGHTFDWIVFTSSKPHANNNNMHMLSNIELDENATSVDKVASRNTSEIEEDDVGFLSKIYAEVVDSRVMLRAISQAVFSLPRVKIVSRDFSIQISNPGIVEAGKEFEITVMVHSFLNTVEKLRLLVLLNEFFLVTSHSSTLIEVKTIILVELLITHFVRIIIQLGISERRNPNTMCRIENWLASIAANSNSLGAHCSVIFQFKWKLK
jgi:hypothetical protein